MATGASQMMMLRGVYEGGISMNDSEVERRPYHKNCGCALHNLKGICSNACSQHRFLSFNKKISWKDCSMHTTASKSSSQSSLAKTRNDRTRRMPEWNYRIN